jgi:hypothetical protein
MQLQNAIIISIGAIILIIGLIYSINIIRILSKYNRARPWILIVFLIAFFLLGYVFTALRFLNIDLLPGVTLEGLVTAIFFFGAIFVLLLAFLNRNLFAGIFGVGVSDSKAIHMLSDYLKIPVRQIYAMIKPKYSVTCDVCKNQVDYSIADIVRSHPRLERGIIVENAMGGVNYRFFVHHYCGKELREIPVRHDSKFEYRSHGPSRLV